MAKPLVIFDGDCGFCKLCVDRWRAVGGSRLEFKPYQEVSARFPQIKILEFQNAVHLVEDQKITKGAEAVFRIKKIAGGSGAWLEVYKKIPLASKIFEAGYAFVSRNRPLVSKFFNRCPF